jgi:hypothetical protein
MYIMSENCHVATILYAGKVQGCKLSPSLVHLLAKV